MLRLFDLRAVHDALERAGPRRGAGVLRLDGSSRSDSWYQADFLWRDEKLIVETDGRDVHTSRRAFEHDRERDQRLTLAGYTVARFTWRQVIEEPQRVVVVRSLLDRLARP